MMSWKWRLSSPKCQSTTAVPIIISVLFSTLLFFYWDIHYAATFLRQNYPTVTLKNKWIPLGNNVSLFSAFYDDRGFRSSHAVIVVLGLEKQHDRSARYRCILFYKNGTKLCLKSNSRLQVLTRVHWVDGLDQNGGKILNYRPFSFTCCLPTLEIPDFVTIARDKQSSKYLKKYTTVAISSEKFVLVTNSKEIQQTTFGVCISSPIFKIDNPQQIIDTFEMNRLLGAKFHTVYIYQASLNSRKILEKYTKDGLAEVVENWGENFPGKAHYYGQLLSITDCLYRNIYRVKYLVYTDLDEVIIPLRHPNWVSLIREIDSPTIGSFNFEMVYLRPVDSPWTKTLNCASGTMINFQSPRYKTFKKRSHADGFTSRRTKYITKTDVSLIAQIHYVEKLVRGFVKVDVSVGDGLLYHYRVPYQSSRHIKFWVIDTIVERYLARLFKAIEHVLCGL